VPEALEKVHRRLKSPSVSPEQLRGILDEMVKKGAINGGMTAYRGKTVPAYGKAPLVVGMFEFQVNRLTRKFVQDFHTYQDEAFADAMYKQKTPQLRTVPVNARVVARGAIGRYDDLRGYVEKSRGPFGVMNCICRQAQGLLGRSCTYTENHETCLSIGPIALWLRRQGQARLAPKGEFLELLDRAEAQGLVLQPQNTQAPQFVCCCCPDCCELLINLRKLPQPADHVDSNYQAHVHEDNCTGCKICEKRCPMKAVTVAGGRARVDPDRCIGCGVCAVFCREKAIELLPRGRQVVPPSTTQSLYKRILLQRYGFLRTLGKAARMVMGGKL
jgi:electron transport complex protein RnfB